METISQRELRNDSGVIMRRVEQGESFTVTRNGSPVADLVPHAPGGSAAPSRFVPIEVIEATAGVLPGWGVTDFAAETAALDSALDDRDSDPWDAA